jgi:hypothetical protein
VRRWIAIAVVAIVVVVTGYAALAPRMGLEWPYPQRLPDEFTWGRWLFNRDAGCHSREWWYRTEKGAGTFTGLGSLTSALGMGGSPLYAWSWELRSGGDYGALFVQRDSGCFTAYANNDAGG